MAHARRRGGAHHLQRLQGRGVHRDGADLRRSSAARSSSWSRSSRELQLIAETAKKHRRAAAHRHPRQAGVARARAAGRRRAAIAPSSACRRARCWRRSSSCARTTCSSCFELLHFHLGSQISAIRAVKNALREAGRFYVEVAKLGAPLKYFDVGGGLGVDYDGSQTNFASSMNYTMQEYANDIVYALQETCDAGRRAHPTIVTESGRAVVAHHSMLVVDILGVGEFDVGKAPEKLPDDAPPRGAEPVRDLPRHHAQERARGLPRRARVQGRGAAAVQRSATCRCRSAWWPRTSSGRSARRC